jgi:O6-methylguanine-DNA--protein-cysteine methyltransferase
VTELVWGSLDTPVGEISVACTPAGVARLRYGAVDAARRHTADEVVDAASALLSAALGELEEYFAGQRKTFTVPVDLSGTSGARRTVLSVLYDTVGFGQTITYGGLAARAGLTDGGHTSEPPGRGPQAGGPPLLPARVVGQFMASNPVGVIVPCHRVVAGNGLGGYSGGTGTDVKQWLLIFEGALPATLDWDPSGMHRAYSAGAPTAGPA